MVVRVLNVAEKNDAAKTIASLLSGGGRCPFRNGRSPYNKIYTFDYTLRGRPVSMEMTSVSGHVFNYDFTGDYRRWGQMPNGDLFDAPISRQVQPNAEKIVETLKHEVRGVQTLIIWTDCDREGEHIAHEIASVCREQNPRLDVWRARFSEITVPAVRRAIENLVRIDMRQADAVDVRQELDLRIGAAFTRLQTSYLKNRVPHAMTSAQRQNGRLVSYGSCQFPTLGFVVERYKAISAFVDEQFWRIRLTHEQNDGVVTSFTWARDRLFMLMPVEMILDECQDAGDARVIKVARKPKSRWRPTPMDTIQMEKLAVRKLRMNAKTAMAAAEKLYTKGFISYPRTETTLFAEGIDLTALVNAQTHHPMWGEFARQIVERGVNARNGTKSDGAHPPIHPLKPMVDNDNDVERRLYELVTRHFLACSSWDARGNETAVTVALGTEEFTATGLHVVELGYMHVYPYDRWTSKTIGAYDEGDTFAPTTLAIVDGWTAPPALLNEADLITLMDKHGIGTDATHAEHINTIKEREYADERANDRRLVPTRLGLALFDGYEKIEASMAKPQMRQQLEIGLLDICEGRATKANVLATQIDNYRRIFETTEDRVIHLANALRAQYDTGNPVAQPMPVERVPRRGNDPDEHGDEDDDLPPPPPAAGAARGIRATPVTQVRQPVQQPVRVLAPPQLTRVQPDRPTTGGYVQSVYTCDKCTGDMQLQDLGGDYTVACTRCANKVWLPGGRQVVQLITTEETLCRKCHVHKVKIKFQRGKKPAAIGKATHIACLMCDKLIHAWRSSSHLPPATGNAQPPTTVPDQQAPNCLCGVPCVQRQVKKADSPNLDRWFFVCAKQREDETHCNHFAWADDNATSTTPARQANPAAPSSSSSAAHHGNAPQCQCRMTANRLIVRKEGPTKGRAFYTCGTGERVCQFFEWADDSAPATTSTTTRTTPSAAPQRGPTSDRAPPNCNCQQPSRLCTTRKEGANKDRMFYRCGTSNDCGFFEWQDEAMPASNARAPLTQHNNARPPPTQYPNNAPTQYHAPPPADTPLDESDEPNCSCGQPARMQIQKSGLRKGEVYYVCAYANLRNTTHQPCSFMRFG